MTRLGHAYAAIDWIGSIIWRRSLSASYVPTMFASQLPKDPAHLALQFADVPRNVA